MGNQTASQGKFNPRGVRRRGSTMANNKQVLIVDDDDALRATLAEQLELHEGFVAYQAEDGARALELVKEHHFEFILMDVGLPDTDGRDLCRLMRRQGIKTPIIMLTAHDSDADTILGLDSGANDYIAKPFRLGVLLARLRAQLRQFELSDDATFPIGPYTFRPSAKMLVNPENSRKIHLTEKETAILKYLYRMGDRPVSREVLLDEVWGYNAGVTTHTLETHIYRLRQKIEPEPTNAQILITEPGGYRLAR
jgi:DNA-binding response OmpR family regulator